MASFVRQLHEQTAGGHLEKEDSWSLAFDGQRLAVLHRWSHANVWNAKRSTSGHKEIDVNDFLASGSEPARTALCRLLEGLFVEGR